MNMAIEKVRAKFPMTRSQWTLLAWLMSGAVSIAVGFSILFIPSKSAELALVAGSLATGVFIVFWAFRRPELGKKIWELPLFKRAAWLLFAPIAFAFMSAGNIYIALFAAHVAMAHSAERSFTVSFKNSDVGHAWKCEHYVRFSDVTMIYLMKACVSTKTFESVRLGSKLTAVGSESALGFRAEAWSEGMQANPTSETDARKISARGSP